MHCIPRHTPKTGTAPAISATSSVLTPASAGVPGPGLTRIPSGPMARASATVTASWRRTTGSAPSSPRYWTRMYTNES